MTTFSLTEVCHLVMREGITCYIEHTGGGVMTLFAGSKVGDVWTVAAGPGRYTGTRLPMLSAEGNLARVQAGGVREAVGKTEAFSVGPGNITDWPRGVWVCPELATVAEIADQIIIQVREQMEVATPVVTPIEQMMSKYITVWSITVDTYGTSVMATEAECLEVLRDNYMDGDEDAPKDDSELLEYAGDNGYIVYIDSHEVEVSDEHDLREQGGDQDAQNPSKQAEPEEVHAEDRT